MHSSGIMLVCMTDVTQILSKIEHGDPSAAELLLPLVYGELRKLAAAKLAGERPGQTLQATAPVHDAYVRLVDVEKAQHWDSRGHFFAAAAQAMRRILIESARRKRLAPRSISKACNWPRVAMTIGFSSCTMRWIDWRPTSQPRHESSKCESSPVCRWRKRQMRRGSPGPPPTVSGPSPAPGWPMPWATNSEKS